MKKEIKDLIIVWTIVFILLIVYLCNAKLWCPI